MLNLRYQAMSETYRRFNALDTAALYAELGWEDLIGKPEWANTCAVRMSIALLDCGVRLHGRIPIKSGPLAGRSVEPGQNRLSDWLVRAHGAPRIVTYDRASTHGPDELFGRRGIVSFMRLPGYPGGHIDLLDAQNGWLVCSRACYFDASEVRFWELD